MRRILIRKLQPGVQVSVPTRWVVASYDPEQIKEPSITIHKYTHSYAWAIAVADLLIKEAK